ncbi:DUF58 domain-containing protein [Flavobacterium sp. MXW15]|uniref:DUF58 domain-containing protein n=1 Tax=Xanthomonas chitinilytica TaxID=2989819 RepID=A0ABT3JYM8_9XANT|nr:DUF58 domain-containing protein [Xanthomonas sp. H13-6]MCW4455952.1 DUF58 domain-containing protein [Flavobacterium sp. MXW15]MCW4473551.1 DUF58 domain-containing protein [Xanthomonas sp. H13-6]
MRPAPLLVALLALWGLGGVAVALGQLPLSAWQATAAAIALLAAVDALRLWRQPSPQVTRQLPEALALNVEREAGLVLESFRRQRLEVFDGVPGGWPLQGLPRALTLKPASETRFGYRFTPTARGTFRFEGVQLRLHSPWRLWRQRRQVAPAQTVRVYPNFAPLTRFALFSAEQASRLVGAHLKRRRGEGTDFHQMREYRVGDSLRQIDWKATSRARKLISREYQDEKNQQLLMLIDTGRRMLADEGGLSHFDHVLNASLVVSYLALRQGDAVGLFASGGQSRWVAPQRGMGAIDTLLRASYDLQAQPVATDYLAAATELSLRQRRRSLVMLITNVRDEDIEDLLAAVRLLQKRHLVCVASLRERELDDALSREVHELPDAVQAGAIARYLQQRGEAHEALRSHRVMVLDVTAEELPGALVERYLAVKRDGLL